MCSEQEGKIKHRIYTQEMYNQVGKNRYKLVYNWNVGMVTKNGGEPSMYKNFSKGHLVKAINFG